MEAKTCKVAKHWGGRKKRVVVCFCDLNSKLNKPFRSEFTISRRGWSVFGSGFRAGFQDLSRLESKPPSFSSVLG